MQLYGYQRIGAKFLASRQRALLADGMGLGKTIQAITAAKDVGANSIAVVAPAIARTMWGRELERATRQVTLGQTDRSDERPPVALVRNR